MNTDTEKYIEDLQDRFYTMMHNFANLLVWLDLEHPEVYKQYKESGYLVKGTEQ